MSAWPKIGTSCNYDGCGRTFVKLSCGSTINVKNDCNGKNLNVVVADCGPNVPRFCGQKAPDCALYAGRIVDLTPAAFSALAPLSQGLLTCVVTTW